MNDRLKALIEKARHVEMTPEQVEEQRISFAFGNTNLENAEITREDVIRSSEILKETQQPPAER